MTPQPHTNPARAQPKGGMCARCIKFTENCGDLPFATMPVIERYEGVAIVKCTQFQRAVA